MRVRINIELDFDGNHTFEWEPYDGPGAIDVPKALLERWSTDREDFQAAFGRWKRVAEEIEDFLYRAERRRARKESSPSFEPPRRPL